MRDLGKLYADAMFLLERDVLHRAEIEQSK